MNEEKNKIYTSTLVVFWLTFAFFILVMAGMYLYFIPYIGIITGVAFMTILSILGIVLIILAAKGKFIKRARVFFILTGASAIGMGLSMVLHNLVFALMIKLFGESILGSMGDEPFFFILATIICPLALLAGAIGSIVLISKKKVSI
jgi:hypothetical protein